MADHLLPSSATPLMIALSRAMDPWARLADGAREVRGWKYQGCMELIPWLVEEYGLGIIVPYVADPARIIAEGLWWQRHKGTPAAVVRALSWIGLDGAILGESMPGGPDWAEVQVDPGLIPEDGHAHAALTLIRETLPARCRLVRLHHGCPGRAVMEGSLLDGTDLLDTLPGVMWDGVLHAFCDRRGGAFDAATSAGRLVGEIRTTIRPLLEVLDCGLPLDDAPAARNVQAGRWEGVGGSVALPGGQSLAGLVTDYRAMPGLDCGPGLDDDPNTLLAPALYRHEEGGPPILDESEAVDDTPWSAAWRIIEEVIAEARAAGTVVPVTMGSGGDEERTARAVTQTTPAWTGVAESLGSGVIEDQPWPFGGWPDAPWGQAGIEIGSYRMTEEV